jgi:hypothetical protein
LRILCQLKGFFWTFEAESRNREAQRFISFFKDLSGYRKNSPLDPFPCLDIANPGPEREKRFQIFDLRLQIFRFQSKLINSLLKFRNFPQSEI